MHPFINTFLLSASSNRLMRGTVLGYEPLSHEDLLLSAHAIIPCPRRPLTAVQYAAMEQEKTAV